MLQSIPVSISVMNSIRLTSAITGNPTLASMRNVSDSLPSMAINVTYDPFPLQSATVGVGIFIAAQTQSLYVASGFTIVAGMIASQIVHERELGVKSMQLMMGINRVMYWISFFIFDYVLYLIPAALSLGLLAILNPSVRYTRTVNCLASSICTVTLLLFRLSIQCRHLEGLSYP